MIHKIYSIYDSKAQAFTLPFFQPTEVMAIRSFSNWANDPEHPFGKNPEDYTLHFIGDYDDNLGSLEQDKTISLGLALQFINQE